MSKTFEQDTSGLVDLNEEDGQVSSGAAGPCLVALLHAPAARQAYVIHLSPIYAYQHPEKFRECLDEASAKLPHGIEIWIGGCERNTAGDHKALRAAVQREVQSRWPTCRVRMHWVNDGDTSIEFELDVDTNEVRAIPG
jgi:hypothetical protein